MALSSRRSKKGPWASPRKSFSRTSVPISDPALPPRAGRTAPARKPCRRSAGLSSRAVRGHAERGRRAAAGIGRGEALGPGEAAIAIFERPDGPLGLAADRPAELQVDGAALEVGPVLE